MSSHYKEDFQSRRRNPDNPHCSNCGAPFSDHHNGRCPRDLCGTVQEQGQRPQRGAQS